MWKYFVEITQNLLVYKAIWPLVESHFYALSIDLSHCIALTWFWPGLTTSSLIYDIDTQIYNGSHCVDASIEFSGVIKFDIYTSTCENSCSHNTSGRLRFFLHLAKIKDWSRGSSKVSGASKMKNKQSIMWK